jgi:ubiquinone/menaquinone biosynthesis C-methylase UbiE
MTDAPHSFDPIWEDKYAHGHAQSYPWDAIVSFVFRNAPSDRSREQVRILEVGCGTASNLWFAAREGFSVAGVDASKSAIATAQARFAAEKLNGVLQVADFTALPFADASFDLVVDRAGLTCAGFSDARKAIQEIHRVTRIGGRFCFNPYSDHHGSRSSGYIDANGLTQGIGAGSLTRVRQICFYGRSQVESLLKNYRILSLQHIVATDMLKPDHEFHAEWRVIAERIA